MKEDKYKYVKIPEEFYYEFFSEGPKGKIKKLVRYKLISASPDHIFNLSFGDWNEKTFDADDSITTNNKDRQKVLATVADTVFDFTQLHPEAFIFVQGSTPSRTRLYQMGISAFWEEIGGLFRVIGYVNGDWKPFRKGINYHAFLIKRK
ncbi:MAG TPA: hypothetical protein VFE32_12610 [Puia sp.]|jgi:hypothetical protein|nr:hypothetical protein [Puia sp.]